MASIGVLALQGDFAEHVAVIGRLGAEAREVRFPADLDGISALIIPGGESTTISGLMDRWRLAAPIASLAHSGMPIWGTCAGLILLARNIVDDSTSTLDLLDADVLRNAYGRQVDSFETDVSIPVLGEAPFRTVFIRAPLIQRVGAGVEVLASLDDGTPIAVQQGNLLGSSFHPELTADTRFHAYLLRLAQEYVRASDAAAV